MNRTTFIGGCPLAEPAFIWPTREPEDYEIEEGLSQPLPLHFICQIDFTDLPESPEALGLPGPGVLYLFYALDLEDHVVSVDSKPFWRFVFQPAVSNASVRQSPPSKLRPIDMGGHQPVADIRIHDPPTGTTELSYMPVALGAIGINRAHASPRSGEVLQGNFPESVRHARCWLLEDLENTITRIPVLMENVEAFAEGKRADHPRVAFFKELKHSYRNSPEITDDEAWRQLSEHWHQDLAVFVARKPVLESLTLAISDLNDQSAVPTSLRKSFTEQLALSAKHSVFGRSWNEETDRAARQYLLSAWPSVDLPLSDCELCKAQAERERGEGNRNQLFGEPDEIQDFSRDEAFQYAQAMGWADSGAVVEDLILFLQLDSCFAGSGMMWADAGRAYFYAFRKDLAAGRFDRISHVLHGY